MYIQEDDLFECGRVGVCFGGTGELRIVSHEVLGQQIDRVEVISHTHAFLKLSFGHLQCVFNLA